MMACRTVCSSALRSLAGAILVCALAAVSVAMEPDVVRLLDGVEHRGTFLGVRDRQLLLEVEGETVHLPLEQAATLKRGLYRIDDKAFSLVLNDGSRLHGLLRAAGKELVLRTTSLGEITVARDDVAALIYAADEDPGLAGEPGVPGVVRTVGGPVNGRLFWADLESAGVRSEAGLEKIPVAELRRAQWRAVRQARRCVLRNGDRFAEAVIQDDGIDVKVAGQAFRVPLTACVSFDWNEDATETRNDHGKD